MTSTTFDTLTAARELEAVGTERSQVDAIAKVANSAAGSDRSELYRALWIQEASVVAILTALRFPPI